MAKLKTYSEIFSGYTFRKSFQQSNNQMFGVINLKDIDSDSLEIKFNDLSTIDDFQGSEKHFLKNQDILVAARGNTNKAILFQQERYSRSAVAAGALIVIRPIPSYLDSAYLAWYLNLPKSQRILRQLQMGTTVQNLSITTLLDFEIIIPPLEKQKLIGDFYVNHLENKRLSRIREKKWDQLINEQIKSIL